MKMIYKVLIIIFLLIIVFSVIFNQKIFGHGKTTEIKGSDSIAVLEKVMIGDMEQYILIRGKNKNNPILLWLHGGPGSSQMSIAHHFDKKLEEEFVIVHWDQRGAGKSNQISFDESTMTFNRFMSDTHELTQYLKKKFTRDKIILLGHSWGTHLGLKVVEKYPEDYLAYIGVSQVINYTSSQEIAYDWLVSKVNDKDLEKLKSLGLPPYRDHLKYVSFIKLIDKYGGGFDMKFTELLRISLKAPEYTFKDYFRYLNGANRGSGIMWDEALYKNFNALTDITNLDVPVYFFMGKNDYNTPLELVEAYSEKLTTENHLVIFESSAHTPFLVETEKFSEELIKVKYNLY